MPAAAAAGGSGTARHEAGVLMVDENGDRKVV
jgi:hypothetical protein